jgi:hypothetical protein
MGPRQSGSTLTVRCNTQSGEHRVGSGSGRRQGGAVGKSGDHRDARSRRDVSDSFRARADDGCETDSFFPAYAEDALTEPTRSAEDRHVQGERARLARSVRRRGRANSPNAALCPIATQRFGVHLT